MIGSVITRLFESDCGTVGAAAALAVPLLLCGIYGSLEIGRYAYAQSAVMYSAEETTRFATVNFDSDEEDLKAVASEKMMGIHKDKIKSINVNAVLNEAGQTKLVTLEIEYQHDFIMPIFDVEGVTIRGSSKGFLVEK